MAHRDVTDADVDALVGRSGLANAALMRGDIGGHLALISHADGYTGHGNDPRRNLTQEVPGSGVRPRPLHAFLHGL